MVEQGEEKFKELSPEEQAEMQADIDDYLGIPRPDEKAGVYQFFKDVLKIKDSSKVSNLNDNEKDAVLLLQKMDDYAGKLWSIKPLGAYYGDEAQRLLSVCDSKNGFLVKQVGTQRREVKKADGEPRKKKRGWFGSKEEAEE